MNITNVPLCVDLDGTLIEGSVTARMLKAYAKRGIFQALKAFCWATRGRPYLKRKLAGIVELDVAALEYNKKFLEFLLKEKNAGRKIFLATGCDKIYADKIADHLGIFSGVFASDGRLNLIAEAKTKALVAIFGDRGFAYAGNSEDDVFVWNKCAERILVRPTGGALKKMRGQKYLLFE